MVFFAVKAFFVIEERIIFPLLFLVLITSQESHDDGVIGDHCVFGERKALLVVLFPICIHP